MGNRRAGVLLHLSSLPGGHGIGSMGAQARQFVDFLARAGQSCWQILPLGPTGYGDSPYQAFSAFAGNPYFIDLDELCAQGLLRPEECGAWSGPEEWVDYGALYVKRYPLLKMAAQRFLEEPNEGFAHFCADHARWLEDYALFMAVKDSRGGAAWQDWPEELRDRQPEALEQFKEEHRGRLSFWKAVQYFFFEQWGRLKAYANEHGVAIIGDMPFYVSADSADVWAHRELFRLDAAGRPTQVAGCPPDRFSPEGQRWGNPLFDWERLAQEDYGWWVARIGHLCRLCDAVRIDHFRGFESYYAVPAGEATARSGSWHKGPGMALFEAVERALGPRPILAEDLGFLTEPVRQLLRDSGFPGMKVLQFAFDRGEERDYLPHNYSHHCVAYAGTHDNNTILGWLSGAEPDTLAYARAYLGIGEQEPHWDVLRALWASVADLAVAQGQDLLGLGGESRMNTPSTPGGNWRWRALPGSFGPELADRLRELTRLYGRLPEQEEP